MDVIASGVLASLVGAHFQPTKEDSGILYVSLYSKLSTVWEIIAKGNLITVRITMSDAAVTRASGTRTYRQC